MIVRSFLVVMAWRVRPAETDAVIAKAQASISKLTNWVIAANEMDSLSVKRPNSMKLVGTFFDS